MDLSEVKHLPKVDHTPAKLDDASRLLLKAADYIERHGWFPGEMRCDGVGASACASNAISWAEKHSPHEDEARDLLKQSLGVPDCGGIFAWNDAPGRTKDEVVAKLRAVALGG